MSSLKASTRTATMCSWRSSSERARPSISGIPGACPVRLAGTLECMTSPRAKLQDPVFWTDASQLVKTVAAAVIAWLLANHVFGIAQPFLAPWAALLTVNATVYRTFARGVQQVGATVLGVLLAFAVGNVLGVSAWSLGLMLLVAMLAGAARGLRDESTTAAATALVVLLTGYSANDHILGARLLDTMIGIGVGLIV